MPDADTKTVSNALILGGAVARGAFEVGVLSVLAAEGVPFRHVVGTSAGALNAAVFGAGLATGRAVHAAQVLEDLWLEHGSWRDFAHVSADAWWHWQGFFDTSKVEELVRHGIELVVEPKSTIAEGGPPAMPNLDVTLITTDLHGRPETADGATRTVYERPERFKASHFTKKSEWARIAKAAAASAAFPGMFAPPLVNDTPRVDGGAVNNAPISYALEAKDVSSVFVVGTQPEQPPPPPKNLGGVTLIGHLADVIINERLSRDLLTARKTNARLRKVEAALHGLPPDKQRAVLDALGWRRIELVEFSPAAPLEGSPFSGFFHPQLRKDYVRAGRDAAKAALTKRAPNVAVATGRAPTITSA